MTNTFSTGIHQVGRLVRELRLHLADLLLPADHKVDVGEGVRSGGGTGVGHLTLAFPMTSRAGSTAVREFMAGLQAELYRAARRDRDAALLPLYRPGRRHGLLLADFDGELEPVLDDLPKHLRPGPGSLARACERCAADAGGRHPKAFVAWARAQSVKAFIGYSAAPGVTARQIKSLATTAGIELDAAERPRSFPFSSSCR